MEINSIKDNDYLCPRCGESNCTAIDSEIDYEGGYIMYVCDDCGARWREYFTTLYDGYEFEDKVYDKDGKLLWDHSEVMKKLRGEV